ncbi:MAG: hypothetical protein KGI54_07245 [Pseudomonadota bacterium]|nr:hypothetical protein [Pseudomonadota bacterium]
MSDRKMLPGLSHKWWTSGTPDLFEDIAKNGGWDENYKYVGFVHSTGREAGFCNSPHNDGWWTVVGSRDEYYLSRVSQEALNKYAEKICYALMGKVRYTKVRNIKP